LRLNKIQTRACNEIAGFKELLQRYKQRMSILGRSDKTFDNYSRHFSAIALHFGMLPIDLEPDQVSDYLYMLQERSKTPSESYFKHTVFGLRSLLKSEGLEYEHLQLPSIKASKKIPVVLSKDEVWRMLMLTKLLKHRILIGLLYGCGLRCMEVRHLRLRDMDFDRKTLHLKVTKGNKDRVLPLSEHLIRGIQSYIAAAQPKDYLFDGQFQDTEGNDKSSIYSSKGVQWAVNQAVKRAGILKDVSTHTLRHTYATHLLEDGLDILTVKELLGHARIETTMEYLHIAQINHNRAFSPIDTLFAQCAPKKEK
jgi:integrase/recombinase XerD